MNAAVPSVKLSYDKLESGDFSIKLRIGLGKERKRYHLPIKEGVIVSPDEYQKIATYHQSQNKRRVSEELRLLYQRIEPYITRAQTLCDTITPFSFPEFTGQFYPSLTPAPIDTTSVVAILGSMEADKNNRDNIGTADSYASAKSSLIRFLGQLTPAERIQWLGSSEASAPLSFYHLTPAFLHAYEQWMLRAGKLPNKPGADWEPASMTTIAVYTSKIRAACNLAIQKKLLSRDDYPFGRGKYIIAAGRNPKRALKKDSVRLIMNHPLEEGSMAQRGRDLWVLSYLSNGINFADLCQLKWESINYKEESITIIRKKTSQTQRGNQVKIVAQLFPQSMAIIERWAAKGPRLPGDYVFPFLTPAMDARRQRAVRAQVIKLTNTYMERLKGELGITEDIGTVAARHSFATILLKSGVAPNEIKNRLAHGSLKTTESYFGDFEDEDVKKLVRESLL